MQRLLPHGSAASAASASKGEEPAKKLPLPADLEVIELDDEEEEIDEFLDEHPAVETVHYPGYHEQQKRLKQTGEWQVRIELEKSRLAAGEVRPEEIYEDSKIEYKLIGSLKRYDGEPTNKAFLKRLQK